MLNIDKEDQGTCSTKLFGKFADKNNDIACVLVFLCKL